MEPIHSRHNRAVVEAGRLHRVRDRRLRNATLLEGPHVLSEALAAGIVPERSFALADDPHEWPNVSVVTEEVMAKLAGTENPRGPVAVIAIPPDRHPASDEDVMVLWGVGDPGNVGAIIRTCGAFGLGVAIGPGTADPWSPKVLRAGAGAHFRAPVFTVAGFDELDGRQLAASVTAGGVAPAGLGDGPWAVLVGSEPHGLPESVVVAASASVTIPMPGGTESLNAAAAAAILAYELAVRSRAGGSDRHH